MSFLSPWFLLGALSLLIPVLIHLMRREPKQRIPFASVLFLRRLPEPVHKRRRLRHWLLFLLRAMALLLLVFAFARPYLRGHSGEGRFGAALVLLVDCSLSMRYDARFARAREKAEAIIANAPLGARIGVIGFSTRVDVRAPLSPDRANARAAVRSLRPTFRATDYARGVQAALSLLEEAEGGERVIYLISDFQRAGWRSAESQIRLPPDVKLVPVDIASEGGENRAILDVRALARVTTPQYAERLLVRVGNFHRSATSSSVRLFVNDRLVQEKRLVLDPETVATVEFAGFPLDPGFNRVRVELDPDRLPEDDRFFAIIRREPPRPVLVLEGARSRALAESASFYVQQALLADEAFGPGRVVVRALADATPEEVKRAEAVVVTAPSMLDSALETALREFVAAGGGMILALGPQTNASTFNRTFGPWLGVRIEGERSEPFSLLTEIETDHPLFRLFADPRRANFSAVRFSGYARLALEPKAEGKRDASPLVLARFHDGWPAILEVARGRGKVLLLAFGLDARWSNLPLTPLYAPLVHEMLVSVRAASLRSFFRVGENVALADAEPAAPLAVFAPDGERLHRGGEEVSEDSTRFMPERIGVYRIRRVGGEEPVAVNVEAGESDLTKMDEAERERMMAAMGGREMSRRTADPGEERVQAERQTMWRALLLAALLLLISEAVLADRTMGRVRGTLGISSPKEEGR
ncbi:MAG: BatA domain-containing protein [Blastocatellia bacterium]|nr:BatA domain-containing protein [Blastocatellia bacterium]MCS7157142.1 BatA domain-containing protein [Blastocatellia bacterium]MCX7752395.1 BatA domain-containing protein [Blastocatellia bacterium]MDW8167278.1 BatA domain-containing protein [Acidobacteriota bacterium]